MALALRIVNGPGSGTRIPIGAGLTIGFDAPPPANLAGDQALGRPHAVIRPTGDASAFIEDVSQGRVTEVNGRRIGAPMQINVGDRLMLGQTSLEVELVASAAAPQPGQSNPAGSLPLPAWQTSPAPVPAKRRSPVFLVVALILIAGALVGGIAIGRHKKSSTTAAAATSTDPDSLPLDVCVPADAGRPGAGHFRYNTSACENGTTVVTAFTLPIHKGTSNGKTVWYVIMDTSDEATSLKLGVNFAPKLANGKGTKGVQVVTQAADGTVDFPGTVDFKHTRVLTPGPTGFPPAPDAAPPSVGDALYSPLIQLPNGVIENAPQIANDSGKADKVLKLDTANLKVLFRAQNGFYENKAVHYASFDSSDSTVAAIEDVTFAPNLNALPTANDEDQKTSAREMLIAFINGPTGKGNPFGQGVNFALQSGGANPSPKNLLHETPLLPMHDDVGSLDYTPMWDVHLAEWTQVAIDAGSRIQMRDVNTVMETKIAVQPDGPAQVTGPGGVPFGAAGVIVNCPLVSIDIP